MTSTPMVGSGPDTIDSFFSLHCLCPHVTLGRICLMPVSLSVPDALSSLVTGYLSAARECQWPVQRIPG